MDFSTHSLFSLSIILAAGSGLARFGKLEHRFLPFILLVWAGLLNEISSIFLAYHHQSNAINYNLYALIEFHLVVWLFKRWGLFKSWPKAFDLLTFVSLSVFGLEWFLSGRDHPFFSYYIILSSFGIVIMSIRNITGMIYYEAFGLWRNPKFLICLAFIIYYAYGLLIEVFLVFGLNFTPQFRVRIYEILSCVNLFTNIIFAVAILWMPLKLRYMRPSSFW